MGYSRPRPEHLAKKLLQIRLSLGVSQGEMVQPLGVQDLIHYNHFQVRTRQERTTARYPARLCSPLGNSRRTNH
jgi:hypothetical protein